MPETNPQALFWGEGGSAYRNLLRSRLESVIKALAEILSFESDSPVMCRGNVKNFNH
jgi:hypothetical protein